MTQQIETARPRPGLRERKKAMTRAALREAALELTREAGPDAVTVDAICARAGFAPRTFFNYFATKDEAIVGWTIEDAAWFAEVICGRPASEDPLTALEAGFAHLLSLTTTSSSWHTQLEVIRRHPELMNQMNGASRRLEAAAAAAIGRRTGRDDTDLEVLLVAAAASAAVRVAITCWLRDLDGTDVQGLLERAFDALRSGLRISDDQFGTTDEEEQVT